jgi:hypothetical protein
MFAPINLNTALATLWAKHPLLAKKSCCSKMPMFCNTNNRDEDHDSACVRGVGLGETAVIQKQAVRHQSATNLFQKQIRA